MSTYICVIVAILSSQSEEYKLSWSLARVVMNERAILWEEVGVQTNDQWWGICMYGLIHTHMYIYNWAMLIRMILTWTWGFVSVVLRYVAGDFNPCL